MKSMFLTSFRKVALAVACAGLFAAPLRAADIKIGLVDLQRVFDGYYKTKQADGALKERGQDAEKVLNGMMEDYKKASDEYKKLLDGSNDQAVSSDERDKRKKSAETKLLEIQEIERSVKQFQATTQDSLDTQRRRMREEILGKIKEIVAVHAKKGGYSHVFDSGAEGVTATPRGINGRSTFLLYTNGQNDMTDDILTEINASAPPETKDAKPEKSDAKPLPDILDPSKKK